MGKIVEIATRRVKETEGLGETKAREVEEGRVISFEEGSERVKQRRQDEEVGMSEDERLDALEEWYDETTRESEMLVVMDYVLREEIAKGRLSREEVTDIERRAVKFRSYLGDLAYGEDSAYDVMINSIPREQLGLYRTPLDSIHIAEEEEEEYVRVVKEAYREAIAQYRGAIEYRQEIGGTPEMLEMLEETLDRLEEEYKERGGKIK